MRIIDTHAHIYPELIAEKATKSIGDFYGLKMNCVGSSNELLKSGREANISRYIVHSVAISPKNVTRINDFVASEKNAHSEFIGYMTLHQDLTEEEMRLEITRAISLGLCGIKMHPDIQQFYIDGEDGLKLCRANNSRLPILFHTGDERYDFSQPERLAKVAKMFKDTIFIGAHFGGYSNWDKLDCYLSTPNVFFDTSSTLFKLDKVAAANIINKLGSERFFFGTDFPIITHTEELKQFDALPLSDDVKEKILHTNAEQVLHIK